MRAIIKVLIVCYSVTNLISCGPILYSTVGQNVPLLQEKGEFSGQIGYGESSGVWSANGAGIQGAYAVSKNVGVISSFYSLGSDRDEDYDWQGKGSYFELGAGIFGGIQNSKFRFEGFGGLGTGSIKNKSLERNSDFINVKYIKPFVQPSLAFSSKYFELAVTPRIVYLSYTSRDDFFFTPTADQINPNQFFDKNHNKIVFEPGIMIRGGFPGAKLELQYNFSNLKEASKEQSVIHNNYFSIGLRFVFANRTLEKE
ncbi:hypothetical protein [Algoriphagus sp.]|uniref:hypothetical protein n=1 Tax=Algoriphagus sp. TaxID=1872435 RepID=UPI00391AF1A7